MKAPFELARPLGRTEHIYWLLDQLYCLNFVVFSELQGSLDEEGLLQALAVVQQENPVLRARIVIDKSGQPCFASVAGKEHRIELQRLPLRNWRKKVEQQLGDPFADEEAPLARFLLFRGKTDKLVVAMVFHHSIADGKSGACVLLDVLRRADGLNSAPQLKAAQPSSQQLDLLHSGNKVKGKLKEFRFWLDTGKNVLKFAEQLPGYDMEPRPERRIKTLPFVLSKAANAALLTVCRERDTTIHGALGAALLLAINHEFRQGGSRYLALNSLADLRSVLAGDLNERDLGLYITTLTTLHRLEKDDNFWALARDIPEQLRAIMSTGDANLINGIYTESVLFKSGAGAAKRVQKIVALAPPSSMLTNIGRIGEQDLESVRIRSLGFAVSPPAQHPLCITAASYGGRMYLNVLYDQCKLDHAQVQRIAQNMVGKLEEIAAQ